jgi:hypothetical protein
MVTDVADYMSSHAISTTIESTRTASSTKSLKQISRLYDAEKADTLLKTLGQRIANGCTHAWNAIPFVFHFLDHALDRACVVSTGTNANGTPCDSTGWKIAKGVTNFLLTITGIRPAIKIATVVADAIFSPVRSLRILGEKLHILAKPQRGGGGETAPLLKRAGPKNSSAAAVARLGGEINVSSQQVNNPQPGTQPAAPQAVGKGIGGEAYKPEAGLRGPLHS